MSLLENLRSRAHLPQDRTPDWNSRPWTPSWALLKRRSRLLTDARPLGRARALCHPPSLRTFQRGPGEEACAQLEDPRESALSFKGSPAWRGLEKSSLTQTLNGTSTLLELSALQTPRTEAFISDSHKEVITGDKTLFHCT